MEDLTKLTVSALKQRLKAAGVAGTGEKPDLIARLKQVATGEAFKVDGINPAALKAGVLKKELATRGLPCSLDLESRDVLVGRLIDVLKQESNSSAAGGSASTGSAVDDADEAIKLAVEMAKQVLTLGEAGDAAGIFSLLGAPITTATPFAAQRKAYLSLSRMIHPDKIGRHFDGATRAFQELVTAFDLLTAPPAADDSAAGGAPGNRKSPTLSRSNDGCHRTRLFCPRCEAEWATADSGLEKYDYNLMMQGLKLYCCAACLCEFGYHPRDYHRHVSCGHPKCRGEFGFMLYTVPPRVEAELRATIKAEQERRMKAREASAARQARAQRKQPPLSDSQRQRQAERCFVRGLIDACPRCGFEPPAGVTTEDLDAHLAGCTDRASHEAHRKVVQRREAAVAKKEERRDAEEEAQNLAAWQFLGGAAEQRWMLTDTQLTKQCEERGLGERGREQMLAALARLDGTTSGQLRLGDGRPTKRPKAATDGDGEGAGGSSSGGAGGGVRLTADTLPSNLHSLSLAQLKAVCASHGMVAKGKTKADVISEMEAALYSGTEAAPLLLE